MPEIARQDFLTLLQESRLIDAGVLAATLADAPDSPRAKSLARHLVNKGLLTRFQAQHLLAGHSGGFFLGQYRILDLIGRGGMGKVYKAEHTTMQRLVALKVLAADVTRTDRSRELFRREVTAAARLMHPNIATAHDANEVNGRAFLVLEYISGPNLSTLVRESGVLNPGLACELIRQAALGLQCAHGLGLVHRDIKPSNLLVQPRSAPTEPACGTVKIVDFGLALMPTADGALPPSNYPSTVVGTPDYLSPEQSRDFHDVDIRSDLYSLGCTFYFLLTGQVPFPGGTALEKVARHASEEAVPADILRPLLDQDIAAVVHQLMAKKPQDRFQTPLELAEALIPFADEQPLPWPPTSKKAVGTVSEDAWPGDDPTHPAIGMNISGTISIAEFASAIQESDQAAFQPDYLDPPTRLPRRFWLAVGLGFALGTALIAAAVHCAN